MLPEPISGVMLSGIQRLIIVVTEIMEFERIPADGSSKMDDNYMDAVEPFNYQDWASFSQVILQDILPTNMMCQVRTAFQELIPV